MKIVYFGTPEFSADFLRALIADAEIDVVGVVTQTDELQGRKKVLTPPPTKAVAGEHNVPVFQPTKLKDATFFDALINLNADLFVVIAYGRIIPQAILDIPKLGCVNVHPSLLPKLRGPSPIISAIVNGEKETGVTIMQIDADMDHGPILAQTSFSIAPNETSASLTQKVVVHGVPLLINTLKRFFAGTVTPQEQNHPDATFCKMLSREDGHIDWSQSAEAIDAKIRAYTPWPGTFAVWKHDGKELTLKILSARIDTEHLDPGVVQMLTDRIMIGTATTALEILELQPAGGKRMSANAFLQGHMDIDGATLS